MANNFTYYPPTSGDNSGIDQSKLKHHYFAQLSQNKHRLIPGMLQKSTHPATGKWIDVANPETTFSKRYFVQYTNFNTLVSGSLIEARTLPKGKWKEVKIPVQPGLPNFHRVVYHEGHIYNVEGGIQQDSSPFAINILRPVVEAIFPELSIPQISANGYYFLGNYAQLIQDTTQMTPWGSESYIKLYSPYFGFSAGFISENPGFGDQLIIEGSMPPGTYSLIFQLYPPYDDQYIVLENFLHKFDPPPPV